MQFKLHTISVLIFALGLSVNAQSCFQELAYGDLCSPENGYTCPSAYICNETCSCPYTHYNNGTTCFPKKFDGASCTSDTECQGYLNPPVKCVNSKCACPTTHVPLENVCKLKKKYQEDCDCASQCDKSKKLLCLKTKSALRVCDCLPGYYWNGAVCTLRKTIGVACNQTSECKTESNLACINGLCACPPRSSWQDVTKTGQYTCACTDGYYGPNCENIQNPCQLGLNGSNAYVGDFNGDGRSDVFCLDSPGNVYVLLSTSTGLQSPNTDKSGLLINTWCQAPNTFEIRDFNGDGKVDIFCKKSGSHLILLSNGSTVIPPAGYTFPSSYCTGASATLYWEDFNGDGRLDLICSNKDVKIQMLSVLVSSPTLALSSPNSNANGNALGGWCIAADQKLYFGDFNNDNKIDALCHTGDSTVYVELSNGVKFISPNSKWDGILGIYCNIQTDNVTLKDYNGDGKADLICQNRQNGNINVALSTGTSLTNLGTIAQSWCYFFPDRIPLQLVDFNNDKSHEFVCNDNISGRNWYLTYGTNVPVYPIGSLQSSYTASCDQYLYGDFNGDSIKDMFCYRRANVPHLSVYLLTKTTALSGIISLDMYSAL